MRYLKTTHHTKCTGVNFNNVHHRGLSTYLRIMLNWIYDKRSPPLSSSSSAFQLCRPFLDNLQGRNPHYCGTHASYPSLV